MDEQTDEHTEQSLPHEPRPEPPSAAQMPSPADNVTSEASTVFGSENKDEHFVIEEKPKKRFPVGTVIFVLILFGLGMWLSVQLRSFFAPAQLPSTAIPTIAPGTDDEITDISDTSDSSISDQTPAPSSVEDDEWVTYTVRGNGSVLSGVTYTLPSSIAALVCDGSSCPSQGTNLPGGTRFTVAARGKGQMLPDFRGAILTDAHGKEFTMQETTIGSITGYGYRGDFTGSTGGGYSFTKMRGILVPVNDELAVDFNHFAPVGVSSDFDADDALFEQIVSSFTAGVGK